MPDPISGHIEVEVTSKGAGEITGAGAEPAAKIPAAKKQAEFYSGSLALFKRFLPFLGLGGGIFAIIKSSKVMGAALESLLSIVGAVTDVILMPLMPIFAKILEAVAPFIPKLMELADAIITPFVNLLIPLIEDAIEWLKSNLGDSGEFIESAKANAELLSAGIGVLLGKEPNISEDRLRKILDIKGYKTEVIPGTGEFEGMDVTRLVPTQEEYWTTGIQEWFKGYDEFWRNFGRNVRETLPDWLADFILGSQQPVNNTLSIGRAQGIDEAIERIANTRGITYITNEFNVGLNTPISLDEFMSYMETRVTKILDDITRQ